MTKNVAIALNWNCCDRPTHKTRTIISAYIVFTRTKTLDQEELETYWAGIKATMKGHPIEVLVAYGTHEVLEGDPIEGIVIAKFPTIKAAKDWYYSEGYWRTPKTFFESQGEPRGRIISPPRLLPGYKSDNLVARERIEQGDQLMSKHITICPSEADGLPRDPGA